MAWVQSTPRQPCWAAHSTALCAAGVGGIGTEESKIAIFEVEGGERGVVALQVLP